VPSLDLEIERRADWTVVRVAGDVDLATADELRRALHATVDRGQVLVVVDLGGVAFLDSIGIGVLVSGLKRARSAGGDLRLAAPALIVRHLLEVAGLLGVFTVADTPEQAAGAP
jgi:anti-sigma B factor antagonist